MPFDHSGHWISTEQAIGAEHRAEQAALESKALMERSTTERMRREVEVRQRYERLSGSPTKRFGPTSFDVGQGLKDPHAFERCAEEFGFKRAVVALAKVSQKAGLLYASYGRAWRLP